ncbi:MAG: hypothetical protein QM485_08005 [Flavobacteriaceae bacterium]
MKIRFDFRMNTFQILVSLMLLFYCVSGEAQSPDKFSYQAVVRNVDGDVASNRAVNATVSLLQGSAQGSEVFSEFHAVTTNVNGLLTLVIGGGNPISSSLDLVDWTNGPFFIKTELVIEGRSGSPIVGISQLMSVPYALYAANASKGDDGADGKSAYQIWLDAGNTGTETDFLASLQGSGENGISDNISIEGDGTALDKYRVLDSGISTVKLADGAVTDTKLASGIDKGKVGLSNVDNTADVDKPISTTVQGVLDTNATSITTLESEQTTQNSAIALNTSKIGLTTAQTTILGNTSGTNTGDQDISVIGTNATAITVLESEQTTQNSAITLNTSKIGLTTAQITILGNTSGTNTGDQDISVIGTNATAITALESEQTTQNSAIALNTAKVGITTAQATIISNTSGTNTGNQDITGIATNATSITTLESEQSTQNSAITLNIAKVGITTAQASEITANTTKAGLPSMSNAQIVVANGSSQAIAVTMTGDITISNTGATSLADDSVTTSKIGTSGIADANKVMETDGSGDPVWVAKTNFNSNELGDIKQGIQAADHNGWIVLNGRAISSLTAAQQTNAGVLGLSGSLPNASNTYLSQNGAALGSVSGSNSKTINQANLPNVNFTGSTNSTSTGDQWLSRILNIGGAGNYHGVNRTISRGNTGWFGRVTNGYDDDPNDYYSTYTTTSHLHSLSINSGGSGAALDIKPQTLSVNVFIYLGN